VPAREPPTSNELIVVPGATAMSAHRSRAFGRLLIISCVKLVWICVFCVSTTGEAPVTVTVSFSDATWSCTLTVAAKPICTTISSRTTVENPGS
jgi:hypothetical protein